MHVLTVCVFFYVFNGVQWLVQLFGPIRIDLDQV